MTANARKFAGILATVALGLMAVPTPVLAGGFGNVGMMSRSMSVGPGQLLTGGNSPSGHTQSSWAPRAYAGGTDLSGQTTGGQGRSKSKVGLIEGDVGRPYVVGKIYDGQSTTGGNAAPSGHTQSSWVPRTYAGSTDLPGQTTGGQGRSKSKFSWWKPF